MIRVLHIVRFLRLNSGVSRTVASLISMQNGDQVHPCLCEFDPARLDDGFRIDHVEYVDCRMSRGGEAFRRWDVRFLKRLTRELKVHRVDVVHSHSLEGLWYGVGASCFSGVPVVHTFHEPPTAITGSAGSGRLWRVLGSRLAAFVMVSTSQYELVAAHLGESALPFRTIFNGIDFERYYHGGTRRNLKMRSRLGLSECDHVLCAVGRFDKGKDYASMLGAFERVHRARPKTGLAIAGDGEELGSIRAMASELGLTDHVRFLGVREDIPEVLQACDLFVTTTQSESFGNAAAEAMASGLPVVAFRASGICDVVVDDETGILVTQRSPEALAREIVRLVDDEATRTAMGKAGQERVRTMFSREAMARSYRALYAEVLSAA